MTADRIHQLRGEINRLIDHLVAEPSSRQTSWEPPVDVIERDDQYEVRIELPGVQADDLQLELRDRDLFLRGSKSRLSGEPPGRTFYLMERFIGTFQLEVEIPRPVQPAESTARLAHGVLVVTLPKLVEQRHRCYSISIVEESCNND